MLLKVLVYEHLSGGGQAGQPIPSGILSEGFGMLRTIVSDFKAAGHEVTVLFDGRLSKLNPPLLADCTIPIFYPQETQKLLTDVARVNDAIYVIAPETGQTLQSWIQFVEQMGKISLNCESSAIQKVGDKAVLSETLEENGLPTPQTLVVNVNDDLERIKHNIRSSSDYPVIIKPIDGVSCSGLSIVKQDDEVEAAVAKVKRGSQKKHFVVQQFVNGKTASVTLLCAGGKASAISLNRQDIKYAKPEEPSNYEGGMVPFDHALKQEAFKVTEKTVKSIPGLRGYVGVDLILAKNKPFILEINPRLTTSYVGLSKISDFNIAQSLIEAVLNEQLPDKYATIGSVCFSKVETPKPNTSIFQKVAKMSEVVSPPFPLDDNTKACSLVAGQGNSLDEACIQFEEAEKLLRDIISGGK